MTQPELPNGEQDMADANAGLDLSNAAKAAWEVRTAPPESLAPRSGWRPGVPWEDLPEEHRVHEIAAFKAGLDALGLRLELNPPADVGGWQPISTAPKDGTRVLLYGPYRYTAGDPENSYAQRVFEAEPVVGEGYYASGIWQIRQATGIPTHWQPLPPPPCGEENSNDPRGLASADAVSHGRIATSASPPASPQSPEGK